MPLRSRRTALRAIASTAAAGALFTAAAATTAAPAVAHASTSEVVTSTGHGKADFGFVAGTFVKDGRRYLKFDRAVMLTGAAARAAKAAHGLDPGEAPDFYIQNDNPRLRVYRVATDVEVYGSQVLTGSPQSRRVPVQRLLDHLAKRPAASTYPPFRVSFSKGHVVRISEQYLP